MRDEVLLTKVGEANVRMEEKVARGARAEGVKPHTECYRPSPT